jgi:hypothetical protein
MPVTAKLSRKFYEQFGDDLTNELVNWMNQVDATYRAEFRDLFEVHFARFDAKLEQRAAQLESKFETKLEQVKTELLRWNFLFWIGTLGTVVALMKL